MGVTDTEERVLLALHEMRPVDTGKVVGGGEEKGPAGGVGTEGEGVGGGGEGADVGARGVRGALDVQGPEAEDRHPLGVDGTGTADAYGGSPLCGEQPGNGVGDDEGTHVTARPDMQPNVLPTKAVPVSIPISIPIPVPVPGPLPKNPLDKKFPRPLLATLVEGDVEKAGPGDMDGGDTVGIGKTAAQHLGDAKRGLSGGPGKLEGDVGGVVPRTPRTGRGDDGTRRNGDGEFPVVDSTAYGAQHGT